MQKWAGYITLPFTWLALFFVFALLTEFILVPWDTAVVRPDVGTLPRVVNDFFETGPGQYSVAVLLMGLSILLTITALRQKPNTALRFALVNLALAAGIWLVFTLAALLNNAVFPYPAGVLYDPTYRGYHRSVIPGVAVAITCGAWLLWLRQNARKAEGL